MKTVEFASISQRGSAVTRSDRGLWGTHKRPSMRAKAYPPRDGDQPEHTTMTSCHWRYRLNRIAKIKRRKFDRQNGRCFYCCQPMWLSDPQDFARRHGISTRAARRFLATAEHLTPRSEGGANSSDNIVAACHYCNRHRHLVRRALPPEPYLLRVRTRLSAGRWHGFIACPVSLG